MIEKLGYKTASAISVFKELIVRDTFDLTVAYKFCILIIFGFFVSIFFNPLTGIPAQDSIFYLNLVGASLCMLLLLNDFWLPKTNNSLKYFWYFTIFSCLSFASTYTLVRSEFYFSWILNFILATVLLHLLTNLATFFMTFIPGVLLGYGVGTIINIYFPSNTHPPYAPFDTTFALYSCGFLVLLIALRIHSAVYVEKQLLGIVEKQVEERTTDLNHALEVKNQFLDNVSHEIRTPIHNITNIVSELDDQWDILPDPEKKDLIKLLKSSNQRLLHLCSNLLDLSKFRNREQTLNITTVLPKKILEDVLEEYHNFGDLVSLKIASNKELKCDYDRLLQVLRNLLDNAIKYAAHTPIHIEVKESGKYMEFSISDEGQGIPPTELKTIFQAFEQSSRTKTRAGGTGLGLSICQNIIEAHNGAIWAKNNAGGGTTFYFTIPMM